MHCASHRRWEVCGGERDEELSVRESRGAVSVRFALGATVARVIAPSNEMAQRPPTGRLRPATRRDRLLAAFATGHREDGTPLDAAGLKLDLLRHLVNTMALDLARGAKMSTKDAATVERALTVFEGLADGPKYWRHFVIEALHEAAWLFARQRSEAWLLSIDDVRMRAFLRELFTPFWSEFFDPVAALRQRIQRGLFPKFDSIHDREIDPALTACLVLPGRKRKGDSRAKWRLILAFVAKIGLPRPSADNEAAQARRLEKDWSELRDEDVPIWNGRPDYGDAYWQRIVSSSLEMLAASHPKLRRAWDEREDVD